MLLFYFECVKFVNCATSTVVRKNELLVIYTYFYILFGN